MRTFAWSLLLFGMGFIGLAAFYQSCDWSWPTVLFSCLAGATLSALISLIVGRMLGVHQLLAETLTEVKATNPLTPELGQRTRIRKEILTDMGFRTKSRVVVELDKVISACDGRQGHGQGADPLYQELKKAVFWSTVQSVFLPKFYH